MVFIGFASAQEFGRSVTVDVRTVVEQPVKRFAQPVQLAQPRAHEAERGLGRPSPPRRPGGIHGVVNKVLRNSQ